MDAVKDSTFVNLAKSINDIQRAVNAPKKDGLQGSTEDDKAMQDTLRKDVVSMVTSPLAQIERLQPLRGLSAAAIKAIRSVHALIESGKFSDHELEAGVMAAVKELRACGGAEEPGRGNDDNGGTADDKAATSTLIIPRETSTTLSNIYYSAGAE